MSKAAGIALVLVALALEAAFLAASHGRLPGPGLALLEPAGGELALALGGAGLFLAGALLLGRAGPERPYRLREVVLLLCTAAGATFTVALVHGVAARWRPELLAALALGGAGQTVAGLGLVLRLSMVADKDRLLFAAGALGSVALGCVYLFLVTLGSG